MSQYEVVGKNFNLLDDTVIGLYASENDNPLGYLNATREDLIFRVDEKSNNRMILKSRSPLSHRVASYLGCIVSADRSQIIWENNTQPLP